MSTQPTAKNAQSMLGRPQLTWLEPPEHWLTAKDIRKQAYTALLEPVQLAVEDAWREELPAESWPLARKCISKAIRLALEDLTMSTRNPRFEYVWRPWGFNLNIPWYWEPPAGEAEPSLPVHQLSAYRWTACCVAYSVRNGLEDLHSAHTSDEGMPRLNRNIRNAIYQVLLVNDVVAWELSAVLRAVFEMEAQGLAVRIPAAAGFFKSP